ncbi:hypothetical protein [Geodermatophilus maliterrae]|uniref:Dolichyl-phosphate-mannose-protein mannosyltransferase n=1 Tax=Geodermatophilus maliterrae TaxID=3162531 RepID=A0ABV3XG24_9ACTN
MQLSTAPAHAPAGPTSTGLWRLQVLVGGVLTAVLALRPPAPVFLYDAKAYLGGAVALLGPGGLVEGGGLTLRGALTPLMYLPAAAVARLLGDDVAGAAVIAQNALVIAVIGVVLIPRLVALWRPVTPTVVLTSAVTTGVLLSGFVTQPLSDLWAVALLLTVVVLLDRPTRWTWLVAGLAAGAAFNIRPATVLPLAAVGLALVVGCRPAVPWFLLGGAAALVPQVLLNRWERAIWAPWPEMTPWLTELQTSFASFVVRYDTVVGDPTRSPGLAFCSPGMAGAIDTPPSSPGELAGVYLTHLPQSLVFAVQKIGAALHWPVSAPYLTDAPVVNAVFSVLVTAVTAVGAAVLLRRTIQRRGAAPLFGPVLVLMVWAGSLLSLVTSATETRFAVALVLLGVAGCAVLVDDGLRRPRTRAARGWVAGTVVVLAVVFAAGVSGMQHPYEGSQPPIEACAAR